MKLFSIEPTVHGYFWDAGKVLLIAESLRYHPIKPPSFNTQSLRCKRTLYALFPCKIIRWKTCLKLFYIEHTVYGYFLGAGTVLNIAGSLRYLRLKHPSFNAHSLQCKRTMYALFPCKIIRWKTCLKHYYIEHRLYGNFLSAGTVLYIEGSLRYLRIKHTSFNAHSLQFKRTLYALFPWKIIRRKLCMKLLYWT